MPPKTALKVLLGLAFAAGLAAITAANFQRDPDFSLFKWRLNREVPLDVKLAPVARGKVVRTIEAPGKVEADVEVKISSQVVGRIIKLPFLEGDEVGENQLLVQLDPVQYQAEVDSVAARIRRLEAAVEVADADLTKSKRDVERARRLFNDKAIGFTELRDVETTLQKDQARLLMAKAELNDAKATLTKAQEDLKRTEIRSPLKGIVSQLMAKEGEVVVIGTMNNPGTVILSISEPGSRVVRARVDENNVPLVKPGQRATVFFQNDIKPLSGRVLRISPKGTKPAGTQAQPASDSDVATFETIIQLDAPPPEVRLGMTANVEIQVDEREGVLTVPTQAVLHRRARELPRGLAQELEDEYPKRQGVKDPARRYHQVVFVCADGKAWCRLVKTGISDESRVEVLSGLEEGDRVVAGPYRVFEKLKDGKPVAELAEKDDPDE